MAKGTSRWIDSIRRNRKISKPEVMSAPFVLFAFQRPRFSLVSHFQRICAGRMWVDIKCLCACQPISIFTRPSWALTCFWPETKEAPPVAIFSDEKNHCLIAVLEAAPIPIAVEALVPSRRLINPSNCRLTNIFRLIHLSWEFDTLITDMLCLGKLFSLIVDREKCDFISD